MSEKSGGVFAQLAKGGFYIPSGAFARLRETRFARPDDGVPIVLRR